MSLESKKLEHPTNHPPKTLIIYWSATGNTEKVALAIRKGLEKENIAPTIKKFGEAEDEEFLDYDLIFAGAPSYAALPPEPVRLFLSTKHKFYMEHGIIKLGAPLIPGKIAVVFCTYSGPHVGINEAIPGVKYMAQFFEHLGFAIRGEWYIVGEFHGRPEFSTKGRLGDIRGRPNEQDLARVENDASTVANSISVAQR